MAKDRITLAQAVNPKEQELVDKIVYSVHKNKTIAETDDFIQGIRATLRYLATAKPEKDDTKKT